MAHSDNSWFQEAGLWSRAATHGRKRPTVAKAYFYVKTTQDRTPDAQVAPAAKNKKNIHIFLFENTAITAIYWEIWGRVLICEKNN